MSLRDPNAPAAPKLPAGSPFSVQPDTYYWSGTEVSGVNSPSYFIVAFVDAFAVLPAPAVNNPAASSAWCVRGGVMAGPQ